MGQSARRRAGNKAGANHERRERRTLIPAATAKRTSRRQRLGGTAVSDRRKACAAFRSCADGGESQVVLARRQIHRAQQADTRDVVKRRSGTGFEPATSRVLVWCSTVELTLASWMPDGSEPRSGTRTGRPDSSILDPSRPRRLADCDTQDRKWTGRSQRGSDRRALFLDRNKLFVESSA
jgi:hypothetical protein